MTLRIQVCRNTFPIWKNSVSGSKAAEAGDAAAQYNLGGLYFAGRGVPEADAGIGRLKSRFGSDIRAIENYLYTIFQNLDRPRHVEV